MLMWNLIFVCCKFLLLFLVYCYFLQFPPAFFLQHHAYMHASLSIDLAHLHSSVFFFASCECVWVGFSLELQPAFNGCCCRTLAQNDCSLLCWSRFSNFPLDPKCLGCWWPPRCATYLCKAVEWTCLCVSSWLPFDLCLCLFEGFPNHERFTLVSNW